MKKIICILTVAMLMSSHALAYLPEVKILPKEEIVKLSDQKLIDAYIETLVELEANRTFHTTSGFAPKEYKAYKDLLRYRILLIMEIHKRKIEIPSSLE